MTRVLFSDDGGTHVARMCEKAVGTACFGSRFLREYAYTSTWRVPVRFDDVRWPQGLRSEGGFPGILLATLPSECTVRGDSPPGMIVHLAGRGARPITAIVLRLALVRSEFRTLARIIVHRTDGMTFPRLGLSLRWS